MGDHHHHHGAAVRATAATPTLSLLRLSAAERLTGACAVLGVLWGLVMWVMG